MNMANPDLTGLLSLDGFSFSVHASPDGRERALVVAQRAERTRVWLDETVGIPPLPPLFVLGADDWPRFATNPVYGLPHVTAERVVVGKEAAGLWSGLQEAIWPNLPEPARRRLNAVYGDPIDLSGFADLLISHELTHVVHGEPSWLMLKSVEPYLVGSAKTLWVMELFANLGLQGYVSDVEPDQQQSLETLFEVVWDHAALPHKLHGLHDMAAAMMSDALNYVWFEFGLQLLARRLWRTAGVTALRALRDTLAGPVLSDDEIHELLMGLDSVVAEAARSWPHWKSADLR